MNRTDSNHRPLLLRLSLLTVFMFGFGFLLVPLYDVFCEITGLNGKVLNTGPVAGVEVDTERRIRVQFIAINNEAMPWGFRPVERELTVFPGEMKHTAYRVTNPSGQFMVGQAVPSVAPSEAAEYLHKVNCFCFENQPLQAGETKEMPLLFTIDAALPEHIRTITLSYTLFDITPEAKPVAQAAATRLPDTGRRLL